MVRKIFTEIFKKFLVGLMVITPLIIVYYLVSSVIVITDEFIYQFVPAQYRPEAFLGKDFPGLGAGISFILIFLIGLFYSSFLGKKVIEFIIYLVEKIPLIGSFYKTLRQFLATIFEDRNKAFSEVVLIEYPRKGLKTLAFVTNKNTKIEKDAITVFVPTTPNPTSGFFLIVPKKEVIKVDISVDEAFRLIVSGGVIEGKS